MIAEERLKDAETVLARIQSVNVSELSEDEARTIYEEVLVRDLPRLNAHLKASGVRPVVPRKPRIPSNPPGPRMMLILFSLDIATRFEQMENRMKRRAKSA